MKPLVSQGWVINWDLQNWAGLGNTTVTAMETFTGRFGAGS